MAAVRVIVASHWHDGNVRGLSEVVKQCPNAEIHISSVFNDAEAFAFLTAYGGFAEKTSARNDRAVLGNPAAV